MMDIALLRESPELIKKNIKAKFQDKKLAVLKKIIALDKQWRKCKTEADQLRADRNKFSKQISEAKKSGKDASQILKTAKEIPDKLEQLEKKSVQLETERDKLLVQMPNILHKEVPLGRDSTENVEIKKFGKIPKFNFEVKSHVELGESLGVLDNNSSAETSGTGFYYLQGDLALLNQALIQFTIKKMISEGFIYVETPLMLRSKVINNVTDLNDQQNQIYRIANDDLSLIGTSEHSLIGRFIDTIIPESKLPIKHTSYSMCFRKEIGSHGIDEKGLYRTHQFNKIEMIVICRPEESMSYFEKMQNITIDIFRDLGIPIRVLAICSGDLGDLKHIQVDIEAWSPRKEEYFEVGSCSNLTDCQARKLKIRADGRGQRYIPHTLNNTALATSRALVAIMENYQQKDGLIAIPDVLIPYMNGKKTIQKIT